ncbi:DUF6519 domain-containing protein [Cellulomonas terrae]|uniref:PASTA domain-containing protein n=1 Tax=Cellulomonas terrae TaxID=311234 RepID=A0A511JHF4_9CELL|nr:DUF6519 domain-containing protein [Cellulomonas terrae]GEL97432.1 hypothetical protein CTE05_09790 [Cellulomonas terrae]
MHADLTRRTFDPALGFRSVVMQQGRVLLDAEWNEQADITAHHDEVRTADIVGPAGGVDPGDGSPGPFAIVSLTTGEVADDGPFPWEDLGVTPGRYYVDGELVESSEPPGPATAWPLTEQPFLPQVSDEPAVGQPGANGRYAVFLDVFDRLVTADERPELLESALGGPDTAARAQTVWQVRLEALLGDEVCSQVAGALPLRVPRLMVAGVADAQAQTDPCSITAGSGYELLENQLYRVEVHDVDGGARFVWSRENGSVVAKLVSVEPSVVTGMDHALELDRVGRDEELSILPGDLVEVTSVALQLQHRPGFLARVGSTVDSVAENVVHVAWLDTAVTSVSALGGTPVVRRWDGGPTPLSAAPQPLEGGITVTFPAGGTPAVGDHWLVPARTVRLAYGVTARQGTIEWPGLPDAPLALAPHGPSTHRAQLGILERDADGWRLVADCRSLFPPLTAMTSIDLVGGDGQEAMPGDELPQPVRVVVRRGAIPVADEDVRFTAAGGSLRTAGGGAGNPLVVATDADGLAEVLWTLDPGGATTQTLTAQRLTDTLDVEDVAVVVTGRLSVASQVQWDPVCRGFAEERTVQDALARLVETPSVALVGGDGQEVAARGSTVPQLVRVAVDSPCGPVRGATVSAAVARTGLVLGVADGSPVPPTLANTPGADQRVATETDEQGVAAFVWQPGFLQRDTGAGATSDVLTIVLETVPGPVQPDEAPIRVTAQLDPPGGRTAGVHVTAVRFFSGEDLENDEVYSFEELGGQFPGIAVLLDAPVLQQSVQGKPVGRVLLELPWPVTPESEVWAAPPAWARRTVEIAGNLNADGALIIWTPQRPLDELFQRVIRQLRLLAAEQQLGEPPLPLLLRLQLDGWAILGEDPALHLNGHATTVMSDRRTALELPTTDEVTGGRFETWFWFDEQRDAPPPRRDLFRPGRIDLGSLDIDPRRLLRPPGRTIQPVDPLPRLVVDDLLGRTRGFVTRRAAEVGVEVTFVEEDAAGVRGGTVLGTDVPAGETLLGGEHLVVRVARGASG